jgi:hypothetical protein
MQRVDSTYLIDGSSQKVTRGRSARTVCATTAAGAASDVHDLDSSGLRRVLRVVVSVVVSLNL